MKCDTCGLPYLVRRDDTKALGIDQYPACTCKWDDEFPQLARMMKEIADLRRRVQGIEDSLYED